METRRAPRFARPCQRKSREFKNKTSCIVRDISTSGAALQFLDATDRILATFDLIIPEHGLRLSCRVAWRAPSRMGVAFL
ncbi:PilZ domain-containing protein [Bradyrhizobium sp. DASA03076]|uniref:PilZ domain-containing protein n=1 Tax=Bradyrhizobium sp. BLXBL-03 TaxID=3395916 RepID=UPI003F70E9C9